MATAQLSVCLERIIAEKSLASRMRQGPNSSTICRHGVKKQRLPGVFSIPRSPHVEHGNGCRSLTINLTEIGSLYLCKGADRNLLRDGPLVVLHDPFWEL